ncbi:phage-like element pbsx protein xkdT [Clostridioides difficile]|uniref:putative phage tail protein n=1 Tax=Clostridioides difficile TaxID=1496 RepID=UPI000D1FA8C3|nr:putative phage tail protein [Clostridioides difficile]UWD43084.1 YmfQ family protein [Clostridioides difficile]UWD46672.1 YmfQ family protein [Clostridioides difficile]VFF94944.1 phage-like element pbsx protein xkdT [Clostridioides difficile]VIG15507.1 phage-like element pbsx protein xkdT [Clostridioides difficile]HBE9436102.1 YmfQ family protein [Clostridioides difficile]
MITSKKGREMLLTLSPIYEQSLVMNSIYEAIGSEFDNLELLNKEIELQLFPQTATWGLEFWESRIGLTTNIDEDIEARRRKVIAKLQMKYIVNPSRLATIIKSYTGTDVYIEEDIAPYTFKVTANVDDVINYEDFKYITNKTKPSHLHWMPSFALKFTDIEKFEVKMINRIFINFRGNISNFLDGMWLLNGSKNLSSYILYHEPINLNMKNKLFIKESEVFTNLKVIIKKNLYYLNGIEMLNGNKLLNAELREEVL